MNDRICRFAAVTAAASAVIWAFSADSGSAAGRPAQSSAPPAYIAPAPVASWTGFYVGVNAGGVFGGSGSANPQAGPIYYSSWTGWGSEAVLSSTLAAHPFGSVSSGFIGGGQIGYNRQFYSSFVVGLEADIQGAAGRAGRASSAGMGTPILYLNERIISLSSAGKRLDFLGTVRGRLGYLVTPTLLVYATGGLAYGGVSSDLAILQANTYGPNTTPDAAHAGGSVSDTRVGWAVGGGAEWKFLPNWSAKIEYMYHDLGEATYVLSPLAARFTPNPIIIRYASAVSASPRFDGHVVRAGLNYHLNFGALDSILAH